MTIHIFKRRRRLIGTLLVIVLAVSSYLLAHRLKSNEANYNAPEDPLLKAKHISNSTSNQWLNYNVNTVEIFQSGFSELNTTPSNETTDNIVANRVQRRLNESRLRIERTLRKIEEDL